MSDQEIRDDFAGEHRGVLLDAIFARFPHQFRPDKAGDRSARIDFRVTGGPGDTSDTYGVRRRARHLPVEKGAARPPTCRSCSARPSSSSSITGTGNPAMMFMMGKVKARGDLGLASGLANWFEAPKG